MYSNKIKETVLKCETIISTSDLVRVNEEFVSIGLISNVRVEIIVSHASRVGLFDLLGYNLRDYKELHEGKKVSIDAYQYALI